MQTFASRGLSRTSGQRVKKETKTQSRSGLLRKQVSTEKGQVEARYCIRWGRHGDENQKDETEESKKEEDERQKRKINLKRR